MDLMLAQHGLRRRVTRTVGHFFSAPHLVAESDAVLTVSERLARHIGAQLGLRIVEPPLPLGGYVMSCVWHERNDAAAPHRWFRLALRRAADQLPLLSEEGDADVKLLQLP